MPIRLPDPPETMGWGEWARISRNLFGVFPHLSNAHSAPGSRNSGLGRVGRGSRNLFGVFRVLELCSSVWSGEVSGKLRTGLCCRHDLPGMSNADSRTLPKLWAGASGPGGSRNLFGVFPVLEACSSVWSGEVSGKLRTGLSCRETSNYGRCMLGRLWKRGGNKCRFGSRTLPRLWAGASGPGGSRNLFSVFPVLEVCSSVWSGEVLGKLRASLSCRETSKRGRCMLVRLRNRGGNKCRFGSRTLPRLWAGASGPGVKEPLRCFSGLRSSVWSGSRVPDPPETMGWGEWAWGSRNLFGVFPVRVLLCGRRSRVNSEPVCVVEKPSKQLGAVQLGAAHARSAPEKGGEQMVKEPFRRFPRLANADSAPGPSRNYGPGASGPG